MKRNMKMKRANICGTGHSAKSRKSGGVIPVAVIPRNRPAPKLPQFNMPTSGMSTLLIKLFKRVGLATPY